mgnify:FL=1
MENATFFESAFINIDFIVKNSPRLLAGCFLFNESLKPTLKISFRQASQFFGSHDPLHAESEGYKLP